MKILSFKIEDLLNSNNFLILAWMSRPTKNNNIKSDEGSIKNFISNVKTDIFYIKTYNKIENFLSKFEIRENEKP